MICVRCQSEVPRESPFSQTSCATKAHYNIQPSWGFPFVLKGSWQDCDKCVNTTHSNFNHLFRLFIDHWVHQKVKGYSFYFEVFEFFVQKVKGLILTANDGTQYFPKSRGVSSKEKNVLPCVPYVGDNLKEKLEPSSKAIISAFKRTLTCVLDVARRLEDIRIIDLFKSVFMHVATLLSSFYHIIDWAFKWTSRCLSSCKQFIEFVFVLCCMCNTFNDSIIWLQVIQDDWELYEIHVYFSLSLMWFR